MATIDDEGSPLPPTGFPGDAMTAAPRSGDGVAPHDIEFDASSRGSQPCASTVSRAPSGGVFASSEHLRENTARCF